MPVMSKQIISAYPQFERLAGDFPYLEVSEFFYDTIQGEGVNIGHPAAFLRLQNCSLNCDWCDTTEVWQEGNPYGVNELVNRILDCELAGKLIAGQHLVITGGSPLRQQQALVYFVERLVQSLGMYPYIEIENECVYKPSARLVEYVSCWNNSPKLKNSGNSLFSRYKPDVIEVTSKLDNSWFKFVVTCDCEWEEIKESFLDTNLIRKEQVVLMPQGQTREELKETMLQTVEMAIKYGVRYTSREHVTLWGKKTGV